jgi:4,5-DOPA dioxygenase extradiol
MNAIQDTNYSRTWAQLGKKLPHPLAVLCISAHWLTNGTSVAVTAKPETIHDFGGFPEELFKVQYPAPGSPSYAKLTAASITSTKVEEDSRWGLDHGAWSVLRHMYPAADVPIFQMSIDYNKPSLYHFELGKQLSKLREKGVLIIASGNVVHNLGQVSWNDPNQKYDWAIEFDDYVKKSIEDNNPTALTSFEKMGKLAQLAHPTPDHYFPLLYAAGLRRKEDQFSFFNDTFDMGSISMRGVIFSGN